LNPPPKKVTLTAVQPTGKFGALVFQGDVVKAFQEKPDGDGNWINGGFFIMSSDILGSLTGDNVILEKDILPDLAKQDQLVAYKHTGFWQNILHKLWQKRLERNTLEL